MINFILWGVLLALAFYIGAFVLHIASLLFVLLLGAIAWLFEKVKGLFVKDPETVDTVNTIAEDREENDSIK